MPFTQILILAAIQGITEFLPISSSGHLILLPKLAGLEDQGLMLDVAVHVGTLGAVMVYFWRDLWAMTIGVARLAKRGRSQETRLAGFLIIGTLPAVAAGYVLSKYFPYYCLLLMLLQRSDICT